MRLYELLLWLDDPKPTYHATKNEAKKEGMERDSKLRPTVIVTELEMPSAKVDFIGILNGKLPSGTSRSQSWQMTVRGGLTSLSKPIEQPSEV